MTQTHPHDPDLVECRNCGQTFDLARQHYYDSLCPNCIDDERRQMSCIICGDSFPPENGQRVKLIGRRTSEIVSVCSTDCADEANTPPWAP